MASRSRRATAPRSATNRKSASSRIRRRKCFFSISLESVGLGGRAQTGEVVFQQLIDSIDGYVWGWIFRGLFRVGCIVTLARKDRRHARAPRFFHCIENPHLVVDQHVMIG